MGIAREGVAPQKSPHLLVFCLIFGAFRTALDQNIGQACRGDLGGHAGSGI